MVENYRYKSMLILKLLKLAQIQWKKSLKAFYGFFSTTFQVNRNIDDATYTGMDIGYTWIY